MCEVSESESWVKRAANRHHLEFMFSFNLHCIDETIELHIYHCYLYGLQVIHCFVDKCKFLISSQKINLKKKRRKNEKNCIDSDLLRFQFFLALWIKKWNRRSINSSWQTSIIILKGKTLADPI